MLEHDVADLFKFLACVYGAGGIVGVADEDGLGAVGDALLELFGGGQGEAVVDGTGDAHDLGAGGAAEGDVVGICGLGQDYLVARVEGRQECQEHGLGAAGGDDDLVGAEVDVVAAVVLHELVTQAGVTVRRGILENLAVDVLEGVEAALGRREIGLADVEAVDLDAACTGLVGQGRELAYRRGRHRLAALRNGRH